MPVDAFIGRVIRRFVLIPRAWLLVCAAGLLVHPTSLVAQSPANPANETVSEANAPASDAEAGEASDAGEQLPLSTRQDAVSLRYRRFETTLLQLAEYLRQTDPDRAELLVRALGKSKETRIPDQLQELVNLLDRGQLGDALDGQESVIEQMQMVLILLQSEDRQSELEREQQRIMALVRDVDKLIGKQIDARAATERGMPSDRAADQQQKVSEQTQQVVEKIQAQDAEKAGKQPGSESGKPQQGSKGGSESQDDSGKPAGEGDKPKPSETPEGNQPEKNDPSKNGKPSESEPKEGDDPQGKPKDKPGSPSEKPSQPSSPMGDSESPSGESSPSKPSPGKPSPGSPQEGSPMPSPEGEESPESSESSPESESSESTPGRQELEQARERMERAIEELKQQKPDKASGEQDRAIAELLKAKEKLEEILRQLREEEQELLLAALEARFRDMLGRQINVYNGTVGLGAIPPEQRTDRQRARGIELARSQDEVALLAAKALTLLKEEGSSIAFPEAVTQLRDDMLTSARRLERMEVGELTQAIQKDIIESLEEILESLQKEMEKSKDKKQQSQQQQQQQQQDPALVDALAELKMLRSLQYRVNRRTKQMGRLVDGEQAQDPDVLQQLRELSSRQAKIQRTADDLASGRNQ